MKKQSIVLAGLLHAIAAAAYIGLVAFVMTNANAWFGTEDTPLTAMAVLMLFVLSAAVMGSLVFVRPVLWYLEDKKREALALLAWTIVFLFLLTLSTFAYMAVIQ